MTNITSAEDLLTVVQTAEQRLAAGEAKARRARALLLEADRAREEARARRAEAERQLASIEKALEKASSLQALVGEEVIAQGEAFLEKTWAEAQAEVTRLHSEAEGTRVEAERLMAAPEVLAYLDHQESWGGRERESSELVNEAALARLSPGEPEGGSGKHGGYLDQRTAEADRVSFLEGAKRFQRGDQARRAKGMAQGEATLQKTGVVTEAEARRRKRRLYRWAERRSRFAQPGDFVFILEFAGETLGRAVHLRPLVARSGRLRFQVVEAWQMNGQAPEEYCDLRARGRTWAWCQPPCGELKGLDRAQAELVRGLSRDRVPGWKINRANARLAARACCDPEPGRWGSRAALRERTAEASQAGQDVEREEGAPRGAAHEEAEPQATRQGHPETDPRPDRRQADGKSVALSAGKDDEGRKNSDGNAPVGLDPEAMDSDDPGASSHLPMTVVGMEALPARTQQRLCAAGLTSRQMVQDVLAAGEGVFLSLSGIGPRTLDMVRANLQTERQGGAGASPLGDPGAGQRSDDGCYLPERPACGVGRFTVAEPSPAPRSQPVTGERADPLNDLPVGVRHRLRRAGLGTARAVAEALEAGEEAFLTRPGIGPQTLQVVRKWLTEMLVAGKVEIPLAKSSREAVGGGDGCQEARCEVTVVGDGLSRRRLAEWRGAARVGLASLSRQLGEIQLLICAEDDALSIIACWPQGEVTLSDLSPNGRSTQMKTMRRIAQQIRARR